MKRILAMVLSVAIIASLAIGGTVAYFTDSDAATNVFTVGNVKIKLLEQQRDGNSLEDFEQNKNLMPIVPDLNDDGEVVTKRDTLGMNTAQNYQDKIVRVENTGKSEAWVRIFVAVPAALENEVDSKVALHWDTGENFVENSTGGSNYTTEFGEAKFINKQTFANVEYNIYCFTRQTPLQPEQTTAAALVGFYLDKNVDYDGVDQYYYIGSKENKDNRITVKGVGAKDENGGYYAPFDVSKGVLIPVCAEAVQAAGFATPAEAFKSAFEAGKTTPYDPWSAGNAVIKLPGAAQTAAEFKTALSKLKGAKGEYTISLNPNMVYDMSGNTAAIACIQPDAEIIIEGNGAVITGLKVPLIQGVNAKKITIRDLTISDADITVSSPVNGVGAFIQYTNAAAHDVTFSNCHLKNSKINSSANRDNDRIGGLIGFACLSEDGSITIENCSVEKCEFNGISMVGGLVGELVQGKMTVTDSAVNDCKITSTGTGKWRIGTVFGRQKKATTTITGFTRSGNTLTQESATDKVLPEAQEINYRYIYGEKDASASLTVDGKTVY